MATTFNADKISFELKGEDGITILKHEEDCSLLICDEDGKVKSDTCLHKSNIETLIPWLIATYQDIGGDKNDLELF